MHMASFTFGSLLILAALSSACTLNTTTNPDGSVTVTGKAKTRFVLDQKPTRESAPYTGQPIIIENDGVNPSLGEGVVVRGDANAAKVTATSDIVAYADDAERDNANKALREAADSFKITDEGGAIVVRCKHSSQNYGTASQAGTGCQNLVITVPSGTTSKPVSVSAKTGVGSVKVSGIVGSVTAEAQGAGDVDVSVSPTQGSTVDVRSQFDATLRLPASFAADRIILVGSKIDAGAFPGLKSGEGFGAAGTGAKLITVTADKDIGDVVLARQ